MTPLTDFQVQYLDASEGADDHNPLLADEPQPEPGDMLGDDQ